MVHETEDIGPCAIMKSRAALVYAIMKKKKLDIGLIIQNSIIHGFQTAIQGFAHLHLITELCQQARVKWNKKEEVKGPKAVIDNNLVFKIRDDDNEVPRVADIGASSSQPRTGTTQDRFQHLETYLNAQFTYINQYQQHLAQYM